MRLSYKTQQLQVFAKMQPDPEKLLSYYERMQLIRLFEEKLAELFASGLLGGTSHFCIGQEAAAVGLLAAAKDTDWVVSNHRGHGHLLARGLDPARVMAELLGRKSGYCGGRGGSQHMCSMEDHFLGTNGITGGGIPIGTGAAFALKYQNSDNVAIVFFGDGASNQGTFHESLNMASLWSLPVLYVCENNRYGMSMPVERACAQPRISARAAAYGMDAAEADGGSLLEVLQAGTEALKVVREKQRPFLLELHCYRHCGHSKNDPRVYRSRDEESRMQELDCLKQCENMLLQRGLGSEAIAQARERARLSIELAAKEALKAPYADSDYAKGGVYA
ncbi:MAG: thiamine pyrophosphate-dependent dehydrogenase E1 component subunit alpha [Lentisphaeria bacterium]|nr:thiamine pyrophosphate-dependent dehydrogenase E1 component subunit alpha [Lentisphaeria bacterium]